MKLKDTLNPLPKKRLVGWHALPPSEQPKGNFTVEPLKKTSEIAQIKAVLSENLRDLSLFVTGIHVGLRASDLLALKWGDICDQDERTMSRISVTEKKTGKCRHIALNEKIRALLQAWRRSSSATQKHHYVWPGPNGGPLTIQRLHQLVRAWCGSADVRGHFGTHTLRKTYGYHLRKNGADIDLLMKIFGHSSAAITLRYIGLEQQDIDEANLKLSL